MATNKEFADAQRLAVADHVKGGRITKQTASFLATMLKQVEVGVLEQGAFTKSTAHMLSLPARTPNPGPEVAVGKLAEECKRPDWIQRFNDAAAILDKLDGEIKAAKPDGRGWLKVRALATTRDPKLAEPCMGWAGHGAASDAAPTVIAEPVAATVAAPVLAATTPSRDERRKAKQAAHAAKLAAEKAAAPATGPATTEETK